MSLLDAPILPAATTLASGYIPFITAAGVEGKLPVGGLLGFLSGDVDDSVEDTHVIASRVNVVVGTAPTVTLPAVDGVIKEVIVLNTASGDCTLDTPGSTKILTGTAEADTLVIATGKSAVLKSNGTRWYHVSNDA